MDLPETFDFTYSEDDYFRYVSARDGQGARPWCALGAAALGFLAVDALGSQPEATPLLLAVAALMLAVAVTGRIPVLRATRRKQAASYLEFHGADRYLEPYAFREIVTVDGDGIELRCGPIDASPDQMARLRKPWAEWHRATVAGGAVLVTCRAGRMNLLRDIWGFRMFERMLTRDRHEDAYLPARALEGRDPREVAAEVNRLIAAAKS